MVPTTIAANAHAVSPPRYTASLRFLATGLAPFLALAPLFNDQLLAFLDGNATAVDGALGCACGELLGAGGAALSLRVCRAVLRFLYNM